MFAGTSKIDITPEKPVFLDGMIREHKSEGIHDHIHARALVLSPTLHPFRGCAVVSVEVCGLTSDATDVMRHKISSATAIPRENIIIAATHTHSAPAAMGIFNPAETDYVNWLGNRIQAVVCSAVKALEPACVGYGTGYERTISHYRRLLADDGKVVMNWEPVPPERIVRPLGDADNEVGVLKVSRAAEPENVIGLLFNHAGHPNILSGENYLISGDYPGYAMREIEETVGGTALFVNGAQGSVDIDGLRDRDIVGVERAGNALAGSVITIARGVKTSHNAQLRIGSIRYNLERRVITKKELAWADSILTQTGGKIAAQADGVGDDYRALLLKRLHEHEGHQLMIEQTCFAVGTCAFISFPGELFTEIGMKIKLASPFPHTLVIGLANGEIGYVPTTRSIAEGGYAVGTREICDDSEAIVTAGSLELLQHVYEM